MATTFEVDVNRIPRSLLAKITGNNHAAIKYFETLGKAVSEDLPANIDGIEERVVTNEADIDQLQIDVVTAQTDATQALDDAAEALSAAETPRVDTYSADATITSEQRIVLCNASTGAMTITLYAASGNTGRELQIKKIDSSANFVTVDGNASETIDGDETFALELEKECITIHCDGTNWVVV